MISLLIVLLSLSISLARNQTKCLSLNDQPCIVKPAFINMNPVELKYYLFMISLNKCAGSFNVSSPRICVTKETKDINVKVFNIITNKKEVEAMTEHISSDCKYKFNSATCN